MTADKVRISVYWDANVILDYINGNEDVLPDIDAILDASAAGTTAIFTSNISTVEVAYGLVEQDGQPKEEVEDAIDAFWDSGVINVVELNPVIARTARALIREGLPKGWTGLRAHDAIHLATAQYMGVSEFHTSEGTKLIRYGEVCGFTVGPVKAQQPQLPSLGRSSRKD